MPNQNTNPMNAALACARMLANADAILREADRLRVTRDELLVAIAENDLRPAPRKNARKQRQAVAQ